MKILHTSDWHLGASIGQEKRYDEFEKVLEELENIITKENIEAIIIAGDVFDSGLPSNKATEMYYSFLARLTKTRIKSVIVTAGNHDSASFLEAPKAILKAFNIRTIGRFNADKIDELIIPLADGNGNISAIVCALPYLRDRDIRKAVSGENIDAQIKSRKEAFISVYQQVCTRAAELYPDKPLIATGHLYLAGSCFSDKDQHVGTLSDISADSLPSNVSYYALGHLHNPQNVGSSHRFRYSGSLLQMSFGDTNSKKSVTILDTDKLDCPPATAELPCICPLLKISGSLNQLKEKINELAEKYTRCRIHAENTGEFEHNLQIKLNDICSNSDVKVISCSNLAPNPALVKIRPKAQDLQKLTPRDVFCTLLEDYTDERKKELTSAFNEALRTLEEQDKNAQ